jgi:molecular chaperone DnaK
MKSDNKDAIEAETKALTEASSKVAERLYAQGQPGPGAGPGAEGEGGGAGQPGQGQPQGAGPEKKQENVVDAEFEEVKDDDHKRG